MMFGSFIAAFEAEASNSIEVSTLTDLIMSRVDVTFARLLPNLLGLLSRTILFECHLTQMA